MPPRPALGPHGRGARPVPCEPARCSGSDPPGGNVVADGDKLLRIYLNDHLAAATVASRLARRCRSSNRDGELGAFLERLADELEDDREALAARGFRRNRFKTGAAVIGERLGLLKLNGRIVNYSPLSRVLELEGLTLVVAFNESLWKTLGDSNRAARSARNLAELERFASEAKRTAFGDETSGRS